MIKIWKNIIFHSIDSAELPGEINMQRRMKMKKGGQEFMRDSIEQAESTTNGICEHIQGNKAFHGSPSPLRKMKFPHGERT